MSSPAESENESFRALAELLPALVWVSKAESGQIEYVNRRWTEFFGSGEPDALRWRMRDHVHPDDFDRANQRWKFSLLTGASYEIQYRLRARDGAYHWFLARGTPVRDEQGRIVRWYGSATNIDAQIREVERTKEVVDRLQDAFIRRDLPQRDNVRFDAAYLPAEDLARVGGDWYDAFELPGGTIVFSIGDVAGHGLEAAVTMANIRQAIFGACIDTEDPAEALIKVNRVLCIQRSIVASAIVGYIRQNRIAYCSAGHPPAVFADASGSRFLQHGGVPLGVETQPPLHTQEVSAPPGSLVVLYTDGLTEARRRIDEDEERLLAACAKAAHSRMLAAQIYREVLGDLRSPDDTAILTLRF